MFPTVRLVQPHWRARRVVESLVASAVGHDVTLVREEAVLGSWLTCSLVLRAADVEVAVEVPDVQCSYTNAPYEGRLTSEYAWRERLVTR